MYMLLGSIPEVSEMNESSALRIIIEFKCAMRTKTEVVLAMYGAEFYIL